MTASRRVAPPAATVEPAGHGTRFTEAVKRVLRSIPPRRVASYGQVAVLAGNPGGARQVVRILHTSSSQDRLPWHRVLRANGEIALPRGRGYEEQRARLEAEGVEFLEDGRVDLERFAWKPGKTRGGGGRVR